VFSNTAIESSPRAAYQGQAADDIHFLQEGSQTLTGRKAVMQTVSLQPGTVQWVPFGGSAAISGDLGYIYGVTYKASDEAHKTALGSYMHVWKRDQDGWKLLIDLELPVPPR
jgi:ketosteroid isomerase-like protein